MGGLELMLMGIYTAVQNGTNYTDLRPPEINDELDMSRLNVYHADTNMKARENLMPREITVTTWQDMPYSGFTCQSGKCTGKGYAFDLLHMIQKNLNFTYKIIQPDRSALGDKKSGMMGQLYNNKVDMAVAFIPMFPDLTEFCHFSTIMDDVEITFFMKRPRESATGSGLLAPFDTKVWICILISLIVVGPIFYVLLFIRTKISDKEKPEKYSLSTCIWFAYGALLKQGSNIVPETDTARLLFATWWIFITILTSFYTANLTAFLTLSEFTLPFNDIGDVVNKHQPWVSFKEHTVDDVLKRIDSDALEPLKTSLKRREGDFIERVDGDQYILEYLNGGKLFLGEKYFITKIVSNDYNEKTKADIDEPKRCTYVMLPDNIYTSPRAFAFSKMSSKTFQNKMNKQLMYLTETGMVKHLKNQDIPSVKICPLDLKSKERRLTTRDLLMTFEVIGVGFGLAVVVFMSETIYNFIKIRMGHSCGRFCDRLCCYAKVQSAELPIYSVDSRPEFLKQSPRPVYESLYNKKLSKKLCINGRDYWVIKENDGDRRLVPIGTPSALLFRY